MAKTPPAYNRVLAEHRRRLNRIAEQQGLRPLRRMYDQAIRDIERRLAALPGGKRDKFTAHQYRLYLGQLRQGSMVIAKRLASGLGDISKKAQTEAVRDLVQDIAKLEKTFTGAEVVLPIEEAGRFQGVVSGVRESMLRNHAVSMANYSARLVKSMENQLSSSLLMGDDLGTAIDRVMNTADVEWWQAERIVRTETIWAYNATQRQGIQESAGELPDMMMRWTEHINDTTGQALDDRVDGGHGRIEDSHAMHGQVAPPGGVFRFPSSMPSGAGIPAKLSRFVGKSWANPPNRPNDRATIAPVRPHWGIPGWRWVNGNRVPWP